MTKRERPEMWFYQQDVPSAVLDSWLAPDGRHIAVATDAGAHVSWVPPDPRPKVGMRKDR